MILSHILRRRLFGIILTTAAALIIWSGLSVMKSSTLRKTKIGRIISEADEKTDIKKIRSYFGRRARQYQERND